MKKVLYALALLAGTICLVVACSNDEPDTGNGNQDMEEVVPGTNHKILIAYFSQPLPNNVDAVTSASRVTVNGELYGSVQYVATIINEATGGDMVRIQTLQPYPENYDDLASQANQERQNNIHPEISTIMMLFSSVILSGGIRCRWPCILSSTSMISTEKPLSRFLRTEVAVGLGPWRILQG